MDKKATILCVDDEENVLHSIKRTLAMEKYNVLTATSGAQGLEILKTEEVDLVISDQKMPNMSGHEFLKIVRENHPECIRIMLSGFSDFESLVKTVNDGEIIRFISKPWDNKELTNVIRIALEQNMIYQQVRRILNNIRDIAKVVHGMRIETVHENDTIVLKINSEEKITSEEDVYKFLEFLLKTFNIEGKEELNILSSSVSRKEKIIIFEIDLGKGVKLRVEVQRSENK
ncbi:MAG: response regulator [Candidatus Omnitrophica bacterium]|nr:response regulator [Candidatus Omnitrophota bacterium]